MLSRKHAEEWRRRRDAILELPLEVAPDMSAEAIMALLVTELARHGRVFEHQPRLA